MLDGRRDLSDEDLIDLVQNQSHQAFDILVARHTEKFYGLAFRILGKEEFAEDIVQDCFIKLWQDPWKWDKQKRVKFTTWFYKIIVNASLDLKRKKKVDLNDEFLDQKAVSVDFDSELDRQYQAKLIRKWLNKLPERQKVALNLSYYEELSHQEIADIMDLGYKAVESLIARARKNLKGLISKTELVS